MITIDLIGIYINLYVEIIVKLAEIDPKQVRQNQLQNKIIEFLRDSDKQVKEQILSLLRQFIYIYYMIVNRKFEQLLNEYCRSAKKMKSLNISLLIKIFLMLLLHLFIMVEIYGQREVAKCIQIVVMSINKGIRKILDEFNQ
ncbi:unnamed protein product [Paramecium pentaurelia]|uniref:Uncharacterized protein n=1 Tax=Paramecium pentaurelia TaxID=43138 RepID=A0A8S1SWE2_9CILI|nr:unnamed protein product [Paramecium pentaurelia]